MLSALHAIARPSVHPSVTRVDQSKTVEVMIMKFSPYGSPLVFAGKVSSKNSIGSPERGRKTREGLDKQAILTLNVNTSKTVGDTSIVTIIQ